MVDPLHLKMGIKMKEHDWKENEFQTNFDNYCSNCNINCFTQGYPFVIHGGVGVSINQITKSFQV